MKYSEEEKQLINDCKLWITEEDIYYTRWFGLNELSVLVNLIEKQDKMIDEILASWKQDDIRSIEDLKEYFRKKVEDEN